MAGVDDGIVSMKFDNAAFEQKLSQTIQSLDKLRQSLDFANSTKGMNEVSAAAKAVDFTHMSNGVDAVSAKFLTLATVAITALSNIVNRAVDAGINIGKSLTIAPAMQGFQEYETNMNSIQTILSNTRADGTNLEQVNAALDQLNEYSDKTIYNFSQMARNIGTFTAAGVNLETAVPAIKGIANLAAVSGSNAEQASSAMYQLSQALASGTVKLIDWNSVVNAGMGGEVFQTALFNTGQMMGTIKNTNLGQTFEEWTAAGNTFRGSLQDGWLTAEVLTTTLQGFTGDLTKAQAMSMGYTAEQADEIVALGADAQDAATKVKTFTQLMGTVKESVATQWATTFRLIIGNFEEARVLFTGINDAIGAVVQRNGEARNDMFLAWKEFGGRNALIEGLVAGLKAIGNILGPLKNAFREVFPPMTAETIIIMTDKFRDFAVRVRELTENYIPRLTYIFRGFFLAIDIVKEVLSGIGQVIGAVFGRIGGSGAGGEALRFFTDIARAVTNFHETMVTNGAIQRFFYDLTRLIQNPLHGLQRLQNRFEDFLGNIPGGGFILSIFDRLGERFGMVQEGIDNFSRGWDVLAEKTSRFREIFDDIGRHISEFFSGLGERLRAAFSSEDLDPAVDALNVGLLGGIIVMIQRFMSMFRNFEIGGSFARTIRQALDGVTESLQAMQANLQSRTLMNIAIAIGILTASLVVLSLIESEALARSLATVAVGLGQLMAAMAILTARAGVTGAARLGAMATTMILLAVAVGILSLAITNISQLGWEELSRGLLGVGIGLGILVAATRLVAADTAGLVRGAAAMIVMSLALLVFGEAVEKFAEMEWESMAQGLIGVGVGLGLMVGALNLIPTEQLAITGGGILLIAGAMWVLAQAVEQFAQMSWEEMGQGLLGVAGGLGAIVLAMRLMPTEQLAVSATGILVMSAALWVMAQAVQEMGGMNFGDMAQGIGGLAAMLIVLSIAMHVMNGTAAGAGALIVVSGALVILTGVLKELGTMSLSELAIGLGAMAAVFVVIGAAALLLGPIVPIIFGLGIALGTIGIAFALFGAGAFLAAKAFEAVANAGQAGIQVLIEVIGVFIDALPGFVGALAASLVSMAAEFVAAIPVLLEALEALIRQVLESATNLIPDLERTLTTLTLALLRMIRNLAPEFIDTGMFLLISLLTTLRNNIHRLASLGMQMLTALATAIEQNLPMLVTAAVRLITTFLEELSNHAEELVTAGVDVLVSFIEGIISNVFRITESVTQLIVAFIAAIVESMDEIITAGADILQWLLTGIANNIMEVATTVTNIVVAFIYALGTNVQAIIDAGFWLLTTILSGIIGGLTEVTRTVGDLITEFITALGGEVNRIMDAGTAVLVNFIAGIGRNINLIINAGVKMVLALLQGISNNALLFINAGFEILIDFLNGIAHAIDKNARPLQDAGFNIVRAIVDGLTDGLGLLVGEAVGAVIDFAQDVLQSAKNFFGISSPSTVFAEIGGFLGMGLAQGISNDTTAQNSAAELAERTIETFRQSLSDIPFSMIGMDDLSPVITPILDLTQVNQEARSLDSLFATTPVTPEVSYTNARHIAHTTEIDREATPEPVYTGPQEVQFIQNNYSPEALSTNDIYRGTNSQLALAKEELGIK
jgi:tape measure domain-containing protein